MQHSAKTLSGEMIFSSLNHPVETLKAAQGEGFRCHGMLAGVSPRKKQIVADKKRKSS